MIGKLIVLLFVILLCTQILPTSSQVSSSSSSSVSGSSSSASSSGSSSSSSSLSSSSSSCATSNGVTNCSSISCNTTGGIYTCILTICITNANRTNCTNNATTTSATNPISSNSIVTYGACPLVPFLPIAGCYDQDATGTSYENTTTCTNVTFCALSDDRASALYTDPNGVLLPNYDWLAVQYVSTLNVTSGIYVNTTNMVSCVTSGNYLSGINEFSGYTSTGVQKWSAALPPPWKQGQYPPVAIVIAGAQGVNKTFFYPSVDSLSLLQVSNSSSSAFMSGSISTRFRIEINGTFSTPHRRFGAIGTGSLPGCDLVIPFYTAVVHLDGGNVDSIEWQDDCSTCASDYCIDSNCGVLVTECALYEPTFASQFTSSTGTTDCDLKIYLAWEGTDASGNVLTSASRTIQNFRAWSLNSLYNNVVDIANQNLPNINPGTASCYGANGAPVPC